MSRWQLIGNPTGELLPCEWFIQWSPVRGINLPFIGSRVLNVVDFELRLFVKICSTLRVSAAAKDDEERNRFFKERVTHMNKRSVVTVLALTRRFKFSIYQCWPIRSYQKGSYLKLKNSFIHVRILIPREVTGTEFHSTLYVTLYSQFPRQWQIIIFSQRLDQILKNVYKRFRRKSFNRNHQNVILNLVTPSETHE